MDHLVRVRLVYDEDEIRIDPRVTAFLKAKPMPDGWQLTLILKKGERQKNVEFHGLMPPEIVAPGQAYIPPNFQIQLLTGDLDDLVLSIERKGVRREAPTSFGAVEGMAECLLPESDGFADEQEDSKNSSSGHDRAKHVQ